VANRSSNVRVRKDPGRALVDAQLRVEQQPAQAVSGGLCTRRVSTQPVHRVHVLECRGGLVLGLPDRESEPRLAWQHRPLEFAHRAVTNSGAVEIATKNRRKGQ
jgi:hypothetical protein